ncbi:uncharacterized protein LOC115630692 [Scaptodrosophila lebanonensis]|uniref:Uncharacterized protein LOC115630692 n=1 Tax=Drosophila lebanonensis TaxID=7225 RepID=A0A6J2U6P1_DROLE|nr:uncharacterized protein LOC115630692 [Scaptodrosophila lebanonensis]
MDFGDNIVYDGDNESIVPTLRPTRSEQMRQLYDRIMPIEPTYDPSMCRDEFLRKLFSELELPEEVESRRPSMSYSTKSISLHSMDSKGSLHPNMSVSSFVRNMNQRRTHSRALKSISTTDLTLDRYKLSVMTGQSDHYKELLESIQRSSLFFMFSRIIDRLRIMHRFASSYGDLNELDVPHKLFNWSMDDFLVRRELPDFVYLDVLVRNHTAESLDWAKFRVDILETLRVFKFFYAEVYRGTHYRRMIAVLLESKQMLAIDEALVEAVTRAHLQHGLLSSRMTEVTWNLWDLYKTRISEDMQARTMEETVRSPIEWRYLRDYYKVLVDMEDMKNNARTQQLNNELSQLSQSILRIRVSWHAKLIAYSQIIDDYREKYDDISRRYAQDMEQCTNDIIRTNSRLNKVRDDYKSAKQRVEFMRGRVQEVKELIEQERQEDINRLKAEQNRREALAAALAAAKLKRKLAKQRNRPGGKRARTQPTARRSDNESIQENLKH